jgi:hypothetical protein
MTTENRKAELCIPENKLKAIYTPTLLMEAILTGILLWGKQQYDSTINIRAPTFGSVLPAKVAVTQAFLEKMNIIGWIIFYAAI